MTKTEIKLATLSQECGLTLCTAGALSKERTIAIVRGKPYYVKTFEGGVIGPFNAGELRKWLAGFSFGMNYHAPGCDCGRLACNERNRIQEASCPRL